jgi:hypothetical protein
MVLYTILLDMYSNPGGLPGNQRLSKDGLCTSTVTMGKAFYCSGSEGQEKRLLLFCLVCFHDALSDKGDYARP